MGSNKESTEKVVHRLSQEMYEALEKQVAAPSVNSNTSPTEAAYKLGVQAVLQTIRRGLVIG